MTSPFLLFVQLFPAMSLKYHWIDHFLADFFFLQRLNYQWIAIQFNLVVMTVGMTTLHLNMCVSCINHIVCQAIMSREAVRRLKISSQYTIGSHRLENGNSWNTWESNGHLLQLWGQGPSEYRPHSWCLMNLYWNDIFLMLIKVTSSL